MLFALAWPVPVYAVSGSVLIVVNEHLLHRDAFAANEIATALSLCSLLLTAGWAEATRGEPHAGSSPGGR